MTNTPRTASHLSKTVTRKRAMLAEAVAAHEAATAAHEAAKAAEAAATAAAPAAKPGCLRLRTPDEKATREAAEAAHLIRLAAFRLRNRREDALATAEDRHRAAVKREAAEAAPALRHSEAEMAAAFSGAVDRVFSDMAANCARIEAERVKRAAALAAASAARGAAERDYNSAQKRSEVDAAALRFAAASRAQSAALDGDFTAYAEHLMQALPEAAEAAPLAGTGSAAQDAANAAWNEAAAREAALHAAAAAVDTAARDHGFNGTEHPAALAAYSAALAAHRLAIEAARDAATLRPTADGEAVDAVACLATLPASLVEAARAYLAAVAADCGVANAARHFGAEKAAVAFENTGDAAAEARALISAANYNAAVKDFRAACKAARNA